MDQYPYAAGAPMRSHTEIIDEFLTDRGSKEDSSGTQDTAAPSSSGGSPVLVASLEELRTMSFWLCGQKVVAFDCEASSNSYLGQVTSGHKLPL